jgi:hypothetical protein
MSKEYPNKAQFNASMNCAGKFNLGDLLLDLNEKDLSNGFNNTTTNSARLKGDVKEHSTSLGGKYKKGSGYLHTGELKKTASHNKSSNLAFSMLEKSDFNEDKISHISKSKQVGRASSLSRGSIGSSSAGGNQNKPKKTWPMKPGYVLNTYKVVLTDYEKREILNYRQIYFVGPNAKKIEGSRTKQFNDGYDDERGDYKIVIGDHIGYRFEVKEQLGKGSFGQAFKCWDHKEKEYVALKIIRNKKKLRYQANVEVSILKHLKELDPEDTHNVIRMKDAILFRNHL